MKRSIIILFVLTMTLTSFNTIQTAPQIAGVDSAANRMAAQVITAFQQRSLQAYEDLFPTLESFQELMDKNASLYGDYLASAKEDFAMHYAAEVLPALDQSFKRIIAEGTTAGIDWPSIKFLSIEYNAQENSSGGPLIITFSSNGKEHQLQFERTLRLNGELKISQFVKLV